MGRPLSPEDLADLCQETFSIVWAKVATYSGRASLETWVSRYCLLQFMNCVRRKRRQTHRRLAGDPLEDTPEGITHLSLDQIRQALGAALAQLDARTAQVIEWRLLDEASFEWIAERLDVPIGTVKTRFYRGLERLRSLLADIDQGAE